MTGGAWYPLADDGAAPPCATVGHADPEGARVPPGRESLSDGRVGLRFSDKSELATLPAMKRTTEAEKLAEAALNSATAARTSARMALLVVIALIIVSIIAFIAALVS